MITCQNTKVQERLVACFAHALKLGVLDQFLNQLNYLSTYGQQRDTYEQPPTQCTLFWDFADYSFGIKVDYTYRPLETTEWRAASMVGGLIFRPGATGPDTTLSVDLNPSDMPSWQVCT